VGRISRTVEVAFGLLARWRSGRAVHTRGTPLDATLIIDPGSATGRALGGPRSRPAVVRASKSVGLPGRLPDLLGMALRVSAGQDRVFDVLLASTGRRGLARLALLPSGNWWGRPYSTLLPYLVDGRRLLLGLQADAGIAPAGADPAEVARAVRHAPVGFTVSETPMLGRRRAIGRLVLESVRADGAPITFDPILNALPRLRPVRPLSALREWAYTGSRWGRGAEPASLCRRPEDAAGVAGR
jgi:hypothetical protein